jgi:hypothetical protein
MRRLAFEIMRVRANKFREVEGEGAAWYASRTEAVGLGRVVPSSSTDFLESPLSFLLIHTEDIFKENRLPAFGGIATLSGVPCKL